MALSLMLGIDTKWTEMHVGRSRIFRMSFHCEGLELTHLLDYGATIHAVELETACEQFSPEAALHAGRVRPYCDALKTRRCGVDLSVAQALFEAVFEERG